MEKLFEFVKKHPVVTVMTLILSVLFLTIVVPLVINICFIKKASIWWMAAEWEAGSALEYYGAVLGFLSTTLLSVLALYQNYEIKKESDARQELLERMEYEKEMPLFRIKNLLCNGNYGNLHLTMLNISDNVAYDLKVSNFKVEDATGAVICESKDVKLKRMELLGKVENEIEFVNDSFLGKNLKLTFQLMCKDKFQKAHTYSVSYMIENTKIFSTKHSYKIIEL